MKVRNYKSAIHNFAHSFQSIDYSQSGKLAMNVLLRFHHLTGGTSVQFDFIHRTISPVGAITESGIKLMNDYLVWLPNLLLSQNCDKDALELLIIKLTSNFKHAITPKGMPDAIELIVTTETTYKLKERDEKVIIINQDEIISKSFLQGLIPEL
jgi:hypothetical protein